jgi:protein-tyrosine kinase
MGKIEDAIGKVQRERRADTARRAEEVAAEAVQEPVVARKLWDYGGRKIVLDRRRLIDTGLLDPDYMRKHLTAEYRQLKLAVRNRAADVDPRGNLVMICSAVSGDGASFLALNLAMSLAAESAQSVVLVDANRYSPALTEKIAGLGAPGLTELLNDERSESSSLICPTDVPGLAFLPIGKSPDTLAACISGERAVHVLDQLASADPERLILFDAEAVLAGGCSQELARGLGQSLLVVRSGTTPQSAVVEALRLIGKERPIGIILNRVVPEPLP